MKQEPKEEAASVEEKKEEKPAEEVKPEEPSVALAIKKQLWGLLLFDVVAWPVCTIILLSHRLRYETRAAIALLFFYVLGLVIIISVGPLSGGPMWLFTFAVLVGVLLGFKAAIMALTVNAITLTIISWLISTGIFGQTN